MIAVLTPPMTLCSLYFPPTPLNSRRLKDKEATEVCLFPSSARAALVSAPLPSLRLISYSVFHHQDHLQQYHMQWR